MNHRREVKILLEIVLVLKTVLDFRSSMSPGSGTKHASSISLQIFFSLPIKSFRFLLSLPLLQNIREERRGEERRRILLGSLLTGSARKDNTSYRAEMQNDAASTTANDDLIVATKSRDFLPNEVDFTSIFCPESPHTLTPYVDTRFVTQQQDLINRNALCITRLREAAMEVESLRQENAALRSVNRELNNHLSFLIQASVQKHCLSSDYNTTSFEILNGFRNLCITGGDGGEEMCEHESPTSVMEVQTVDATERISLPKSISVRSNGYLKTSQAGVSKTRGVTRPKTASPIKAVQKVYVRGGKTEEEPLELEVYNQGMFKTELCNKWQETGTCPYGDHCQFAHGIEELRPVIRHPRYKTEVCRMVLAGDICPYGHRCHFRHVLTEEERFMGQLKPRAIKLER